MTERSDGSEPPPSIPVTRARALAAMRADYGAAGLTEGELAAQWWIQFDRWLDQTVAAGVAEPNAMVLATADATGRPASRTVLAKQVDAAGVVFYTNLDSTKSRDLAENPYASVTFPWYAIGRQVHLRGTVQRVDAATTAAYWVTRPRGSQLGAWASPQSRVIPDRAELDRRQAEMAARFGDLDATTPIPVPPHWGGWRLVPQLVEFWQGRTARLHDRLRYRHSDDGWVIERLGP